VPKIPKIDSLPRIRSIFLDPLLPPVA